MYIKGVVLVLENELMKVFAANIRQLRKWNKLLQKDLAKILGVSNSIVSDWEKGNKMPRAGVIQKISDYFDVPKSSLFEVPGTSFTTLRETILVPIVGQISCGNGVLAYEDIEGYETTPKEWLNGGDYFYLRAKGDSMIGSRIYEGDLLLIRKQEEVEEGEIAAVMIENEAILKRVYRRGDNMVLQSENPLYPPIVCVKGEVRVIGKLKKIVINL